jgi:hypothetical protein
LLLPLPLLLRTLVMMMVPKDTVGVEVAPPLAPLLLLPLEMEIVAQPVLVCVVGVDNHIDEAWLGKGTRARDWGSLGRILANARGYIHNHSFGRVYISGAHNGCIVYSEGTGGDARTEDNGARCDEDDVDIDAAADAQ